MKMPLPAVLAAKLAKRGIINKKRAKAKSASQNQQTNIVEEEVIAEDYDSNRKDIDEYGFESLELKFKGHPGCPNKSNIYHDCNIKCKELWGLGKIEPNEKYLKKKLRMLQKYPLPETWTEVYDPGTGRYFYWDKNTDMVCWLSPLHPKAVISESAKQLREERHLKQTDQEENDSDVGSDEEILASDEETSEKRRRAEQEKKTLREPERDRERERPWSKGRIKTKDNDIDPMDPAAYSDTPRGNWSTGLAKKNEAKTGADVTANGPLYQMRPYPSPGAVLRANMSNKNKESDDE